MNKIKIIIDYQIKSFERLFNECKCIEKINFKKFYRNNITNMSCMFSGCSDDLKRKIKSENMNIILKKKIK